MTVRSGGPWVVVVGMHRSGTSAVTGALGGLGLQVPRPGDRMAWHESNPEHWESLSVALHDDELLHALGGSWDAPPDLEGHWAHTAAVWAGGHSGALLADAFPDSGPSALKDPRLCLLLPYWRRVLPAVAAAILVWRSPVDVARSLQRRDGLPLATGVALWERYNRSALAGLAGVDTYVVHFDDVVADPAGSVSAWAKWLGELPALAPSRAKWDVGRAAPVVSADLRHQTGGEPVPVGLLSEAQQHLEGQLAEVGGGHRPLPRIALSPETPWTVALLAARRASVPAAVRADQALQRFWIMRQRWAEVRQGLAEARARAAAERARLEAERDDARSALAEAESKLDQLYHSTSWKVTAPLRSSLARVEQWNEQWKRRPPGPGRP